MPGHDDERMIGAPTTFKRAAAVALVAGAALAAVASASAARPATPPDKPAQAQTNPSKGSKSQGAQVSNQGLVQSISPAAVLLKALDGTTFSVPFGHQTRVLVDGRLAPASDIKPGFVVLIKWNGGNVPQQIAAFDLSAKSGERLATVEKATKTAVVVTGASGGHQTIHVNVRTRVFLDGKLSSIRNVKAGYTLVTSAGTPKGGKPAVELFFLTPS